jgi:hypothetical protein
MLEEIAYTVGYIVGFIKAHTIWWLIKLRIG